MVFGIILLPFFGVFGTALAAQSLLSPQFFNATLSYGVDVRVWGVATPNTVVHVTVGGGAAVTAKVFAFCPLVSGHILFKDKKSLIFGAGTVCYQFLRLTVFSEQ